MPTPSTPEGPDAAPEGAAEPSDAELMALVYDELRALAGAYLAREHAGHTLQPTALVHEAYLRVSAQSQVQWKNPAHLRALSAIAMRRVLVDHARGKLAAKRGGGQERVTLGGDLVGAEDAALDALELDAALVRLAAVDERRARGVELRFFGGLTNREVAEELGVSESTVEADWRFAQAWLKRELDR
jgi:RNA polymerase sigma factor (TIGR02999 family)